MKPLALVGAGRPGPRPRRSAPLHRERRRRVRSQSAARRRPAHPGPRRQQAGAMTGIDANVLLAIAKVECDYGRCRSAQPDNLVPADIRAHVDVAALQPGSATAQLLGLPDGRHIGDWVNPKPVDSQRAIGLAVPPLHLARGGGRCARTPHRPLPPARRDDGRRVVRGEVGAGQGGRAASRAAQCSGDVRRQHRVRRRDPAARRARHGRRRGGPIAHRPTDPGARVGPTRAHAVLAVGDPRWNHCRRSTATPSTSTASPRPRGSK